MCKTTKLTLEEIKQIFIDKGYIPLFNEYKNVDEKLLIQSKEGYKFLCAIKHFKKGHVPSLTNTNNPYSIYNINLWLKLNNKDFVLLSDKYMKAKDKLKFKCLIDNYTWESTWDKIYNCNQGCPKCGGSLKLTLNICKERLKEINPNIEILSNTYINSKTKLNCRCLLDNHEWSVTWADLSSGYGCPRCCCNSNVVDSYNSLESLRPDLIKFLKNKDDGGLYTQFSSHKIEVCCPNCGCEKEMIISNLSKQGFSCDYCSDGISIPNKFMMSLFKQLKISFVTEKCFNWSKNKKYDIFLSEFNIICENNGIQHYEKSFEKISKKARTLEEEQENDRIKKELAIQNGIKEENYVVLDCRKSELEFIKKSILNSNLNKIFDLSDVDWECIWKECQKSIIKETWEVWNNRDDDDTTQTIANKIGISQTSVLRYLKIGNDLNKCSYDAKLEKSKVSSRIGKLNGRKILQLDTDENIINIFDSSMDAYRKTNISFGNICSVLRGEKTLANGYMWKYA